MFRSKKLACLFLMGALMAAPAVQAQVNPQQQQQQLPKIEVNDDEMKTFAKVFQTVQVENNKFRQEVAGMLNEEGMEVQRFNEIHEASQNPTIQVDATDEEKEKHQRVLGKIQERQVVMIGDIEKMIADVGMTLKRYEEIMMHLQVDPELQQQLKTALGG